MERQEPTKHSWYAVFLLTMGHFFSDFYSNFLPMLLPIVMERLGLSLTVSGLLIMSLSLTSNVLQPFFGYWMDKYRLNWLILFTVPAGAIFICYSALVDTKTALFLFVSLSGLAVSVFHPLGSSLISKVSAAQKLGSSISIFVGGGNLGFALAPIILVYFTSQFSLNALPLLILPSFLLAAGYYQSGLYRSAARTSRAAFSKLPPFYKDLDLIKLNLVMGLRAWTHVAITTFLPVWLTTQGFNTTYAGLMLTVFLTGAALGGLAGGYAGDRFGVKKIIVGSLALCILPTYLFLTIEEITWFTWIVIFFCGAGLQCPAPSSLVWAQKLLPNYEGMASGMMLGLSFGLGGIGAAVTGAMGDEIGLHNALKWTLLPLVASVAIAMTIPKPESRKPAIDQVHENQTEKF